MKKSLLGIAVIALLFSSCNDDQNDFQEEAIVDMSDFYLYTDAAEDGPLGRPALQSKNCSSMEVLNRQLNENPGLYQKMYNAELHTRRFIASNAKKPDGAGNGNGGGGTTPPPPTDPPADDGLGTINIPVYVYVIYSNQDENISDAQINSQIQVLNDDFGDEDFSDVRSEFKDLGANINVKFVLQVIDRISNPRTDWGLNDAVKAEYPAPDGYLTMWVAQLPTGYLGYAQFPGGETSTDGVVMSPQYFGSSDYDTQDNFFLSAQFGLGRTTTHEVGHWMNLRHIWGDGRCRQDDFVSDTPSSDGPNYGCGLSVVSCKSTDMVENYMDYSDDDCMGLFTEGQKSRMRAIFATVDGQAGPRASFIN